MSGHVSPAIAGLTVATIVGFAPLCAVAQTTTADGAGEPALETVIVTAQKRAENLQSTPIAVSAFNERMLETLQIDDVDKLAQFTPGFTVTRSVGAGYTFLRGVGISSVTPGTDPTVATYVDGVYRPSAFASSFLYKDIAGIEVLKGPQGTLFGRNAVGGVLNITTRDPTHAPRLDLEAGYASYQDVSAALYASGSITDNFAANISISGQRQHEGWGTNLFTGKDIYFTRSFAARTKWLITPTDDLTITFALDYARNKPANAGLLFAAKYFPNKTFGSPPAPGGFFDSFQSYQNGTDVIQYGTLLKIDYDLSWAEFSSLTSYRESQARVKTNSAIVGPGIVGLANGIFNNFNKTATQEFQLQSPASSKIQWIGGLFLYYDRTGMNPFGSETGVPATTTYLYSRQDTTSYAAYAQATAPLAEQTRLTAGIRYTEDHRSIDGQRFNGLGGVIAGGGSASRTWPKVTYRLALDHDFTDDILGYASVSRGFESGAFNLSSGPLTAPTEPETLDSYEVGLKSNFFQDRLRANVAVFYYDFKDLIVSQRVGNLTVKNNAGKARIKGVDFDLMAAVTGDLNLQAGFEVLDPKYKVFRNAVFFLPTADPVRNTTSSGDASGNYIIATERFTGNVNAQYTVASGAGEFLFAGGAVYHSGRYWDAQNLLKEPSYTLLQASITWTSPSEKWDVKLWSENLTDERFAVAQSVGTTAPIYIPGAPRTVGVRLRYHWF